MYSYTINKLFVRNVILWIEILQIHTKFFEMREIYVVINLLKEYKT